MKSSLMDRYIKKGSFCFFMKGVCSLAPKPDTNVLFGDYLKGNDAEDTSSDWLRVGDDLRFAMSNLKY